MTLKSLNLSLSSICGAKCIYCPADRCSHISTLFMPLSLAMKIIDDAKTISTLEKIELGENGDALLNLDFLEIARYIKKEIPHIKVSLYSNFQNLTKPISEVLLQEKLIDEFHVNIDGYDAETYYSVKQLEFENVINNLNDFLCARTTLNSYCKLEIFTLDYDTYYNKIFKKYLNVHTIYDGTTLKRTREFVRAITPYDVTGYIMNPFGWAERNRIDKSKIDYKTQTCPMLKKNEEEMFVASDGSVYLCCLDSKPVLILGNLKKQTIIDVFNSRLKLVYMTMLNDKRFIEIGGPCSTVVCCHRIE